MGFFEGYFCKQAQPATWGGSGEAIFEFSTPGHILGIHVPELFPKGLKLKRL
jgi:hypothetical protein